MPTFLLSLLYCNKYLIKDSSLFNINTALFIYITVPSVSLQSTMISLEHALAQLIFSPWLSTCIQMNIFDVQLCYSLFENAYLNVYRIRTPMQTKYVLKRFSNVWEIQTEYCAFNPNNDDGPSVDFSQLRNLNTEFTKKYSSTLNLVWEFLLKIPVKILDRSSVWVSWSIQCNFPECHVRVMTFDAEVNIGPLMQRWNTKVLKKFQNKFNVRKEVGSYNAFKTGFVVPCFGEILIAQPIMKV